MTILSGYVATPVPGPLTVDTPVPGPVVAATGIPGPTVVPTPVPFWLREIFGYLAAEGEITVQVGGIRMDSTEAIVRGNGRVASAVSSVWLSASEQLLTSLGRLEVLARFGANAGTRLLEGVGSVVLSSFAPKLPAGVRTLAGRGAVTASGILHRLRPAGVTLAGRGAVTASVTGEKMDAGTRTLAAGRGAFVVASISQNLSAPSFVTASTGTTNVSITVPEGGTIVAFSYDNTGYSIVTCSGGVTMTSAATAYYDTTRISYAVGVAAGTYTVTVSGYGGAFRTMIVAAYQGVTAVSGGVSGGANNTTPTLTPTGTPGLLAVAGFRGYSMPSGTTTSNGDIRSRATNAAQPMDLILVDRSTTPVSLSLASSTSWIGVGLWLS